MATTQAVQKGTTMSQWITHDGKGCPVNPRKIVNVKYRNGTIHKNVEALEYDWIFWERDPKTDIIAYQVIEPYKGKQDATE